MQKWDDSEKRDWCRWCCKKSTVKQMFCVRDGPVDWRFCNSRHTEMWLEYRHRKKSYSLCRMLPQQRVSELKGKTMEEHISILYPEDAGTITSYGTNDVCNLHNC